MATTTLTDEQYQQFLAIYDDAHEGLTYDHDSLGYLIAEDSPWDILERSDGAIVHVNTDGHGTLWINADTVAEEYQSALEQAGFTGDLLEQCQARLHESNR